LLFGRGKIPQLMSDLAEGINSFKKGVKDIHAEDETLPDQLKDAKVSENKI